MRISFYTLLILAVIFMLASTGCPSDTGSTDTPEPQATNGDVNGDDPDEPVEPAELYFTGDTPAELLAKWEEIGEEDIEGLDEWLLDLEGNYFDLVEWHLSEIDWDEIDEYEVDLPAGNWKIYGWSGGGIIDLDMYVLGEGGEEDVLVEDILLDSFPELLFTLEEAQTVTLLVEPFEVEEDVINANYCWWLVMGD